MLGGRRSRTPHRDDPVTVDSRPRPGAVLPLHHLSLPAANRERRATRPEPAEMPAAF
jgi:hypothetical protein